MLTVDFALRGVGNVAPVQVPVDDNIGKLITRARKALEAQGVEPLNALRIRHGRRVLWERVGHNPFGWR